jgi:Tfp pilus assembly protein FimT
MPTFPYIGTNGLFTRVGAIGGLLNAVNSLAGTANLAGAGIESVGPAIDKIAATYAAPDINLIGGLYAARDSYRGVHSSLLTYLQTLAQSTVIQMVNDFAPQPQSTLATSLQWLVKQMATDAQTVAKPTISTTPASTAGNIGSGLMVATPLGPNGVQQDYIDFVETLTASCTTDSQTGGATVGLETFAFTGPPKENNPLLWDWPLGSGTTGTLAAVDALQNNSGNQLLQNGAGQTWTTPSSGPDNWLLLTGTAGTQIVQASGSNVYSGSSGFSFVGDSATLTSISQAFKATPGNTGNTGGTAAALAPLTQYVLNLFLKLSVAPAAGVLEISLTDGLNNILNDAAGNPNTLTIALSAGTTSFVAHNAFFRTPAVIPASGYRVRVRLTTALSTGSTLYFGHIALSPAASIYPGGPYGRIFSGLPAFISGDSLTIAVANNYASKWQLLADRLFGMRALGLQLPSGGSPTILDSLIA